MPEETNKQPIEEFDFVGEMRLVDLDAIEAAEDPGRNYPIVLDLYNGGVLELAYGKVIVDIDGMRLKPGQIKILANHHHPLGFASEVSAKNNAVVMSGELCRDPADQILAQIVNKSKAGLVWEASMGARALRTEFVEAGATVTVNGREFVGPIRIARESELREGSIVLFGADGTTSVEIAAKRHEPNKEVDQMADKTKKEEGGDVTIEAQAPATPPTPSPVDTGIEAQNQAHAANLERIAAIEAFDGPADIKATAIRDGWTVPAAELALIKARRPEAPAIVPSRTEGLTTEIIEASARLFGIEDRTDVEKDYSSEILDKAERIRANGIKATIAAACNMIGAPVPAVNATDREWIRAAFFSANDVDNLVGNIANKVMLAAFNRMPSAAVRVARRLSANDFKTHTGIRLTANAIYEKVGPGGEIKHGEYNEDTYSYKVETYARMLGITRQMLRNDDMGQFMETARVLGEGAFLAREKTFFEFFLSNPVTSDGTAIFDASHNNVDTGGEGVDDSGYTVADKLLREQSDNTDEGDGNGSPIEVVGSMVLVPPALSAAARRMYRSQNLLPAGDTDRLEGDSNIWAGEFMPVTSPRIGANRGGSDSAWYLLSELVRAFGIAYLDNRDTPIIEEVDLAGEYLGRAWRGYFDFGVNTIDYQGAVEMS